MEVGVKFRYAFQAVRGDPSASAGGIYIDDVSLSETRCPNAVWRIQNFSKIMETATNDTVLYSPHFYSPEGYAYGVQVVPLSTYTDYTGNYTGLYFHLASGENDAVLQWPAINRQATLVVMDQDPDIKLRMSTARSLTTDMRSEFLPSENKKKNRHITRNANGCTIVATTWPPIKIHLIYLFYSKWGKACRSALCPLASDGKLLWDNPSKVGTYDSSCGCYRGPRLGWRNFVKHFDLRRRNYLKNDDLIIFIDFEGKRSAFFIWLEIHANYKYYQMCPQT